MQSPLQTETVNQLKPYAAPVIVNNGREYMADAKGTLVPVTAIKAQDLLMDESVSKMIAFARDLSGQIARFKGHCFADVGAFMALLAQDYGAKMGGKKGNVTLTSFDGCRKVQIQVADLIEFGPELQAAKALVDECLMEWGADSREELRAVVSRAFQVDKQGKINRAELFMLLRVEISDDRWVRAMAAVRDSIRVIGSKTYIRFYERAEAGEPWQSIAIDLAQA